MIAFLSWLSQQEMAIATPMTAVGALLLSIGIGLALVVLLTIVHLVRRLMTAGDD